VRLNGNNEPTVTFVVRLLFAVSVFLGLVSLEARAQNLTFQSNDSTLSCLTPASSEAKPISYPKSLLERKQGALIRLQITFKGGDLEPEVEVIANTGDDDFATLARRRASEYRLPCMKPGQAPVVARQEFDFRPTDSRPVSWSGVERQTESFRGCAMLDGEPFPWRRWPAYPDYLIRKDVEGVVLASMTFNSSAQPPQVRILFDSGSPALANEVIQYLQGVRLSCLPAGQSVTARIPFHFRIEGNRRFNLKDLTLQQFVGAIEPKAVEAPSGKVRFDLSSMGCPFDVLLELWQPYDENIVGAVGERDPRREPFLKWLKTVPLALKPDQLKHVLGGHTRISVPCGSLDLT
jgi:hypothetical protein